MSGDRTTEGREDGGARRARPRRPRRRRATALLPQILGAAVEIDPDRDAVSFDGRALSYAELDSRSSRIARVLIGRGIGPEDVVAVGITRSMESVLALWSITKTGAAFVPVDPTYPVDRVQHMLSDSGARNGLTTSAHRGGLPDTCSWSILGEADFEAAIAAESDEKISVYDRVRPLRAENPAYIIYTSGSTGRPKGVVVTHRLGRPGRRATGPLRSDIVLAHVGFRVSEFRRVDSGVVARRCCGFDDGHYADRHLRR